MKKIVSLALLVFLIVGCGAKSEEEKLCDIIGIEVDVDSAKIEEDGIYSNKVFNTNGCEYSIIYLEESIVGFSAKKSDKCTTDAKTVLKNEMFLSEEGLKEFESSEINNGVYLIDSYTIKAKNDEFLFIKEGKPKTSSELIRRMKELGLPIIKNTQYNESNDPNELLGRPGEYIEKINFKDENALNRKIEDFKKELGQYSTDSAIKDYKNNLLDDLDCTVEMFNNTEDLNIRFDYIENIGESITSLNLKQYMYKNDKFLLRLSYDITPKEAKKYDETFNKLFEEQ